MVFRAQHRHTALEIFLVRLNDRNTTYRRMNYAKLTCSLLLLTTSLLAQKQDPMLHGKWIFESIQRANETEPVSKKTMQLAVGDSAFYHFLPNNRFRMCEYSCINGTWELNANNQLLLSTDEGRIVWYPILKLSQDTLVINVRDKVIHTLIKAKDTSPFADTANVKMAGLIKIKPAQLAKRWKLTVIKNENEKASTMESINRIFAGAIFDLNADNTCRIKRIKEQAGRWNLLYKNSTIRILYEDEGELWRIISLSADKLILQKPGGSNLFVFTPF